MNTHKASKGNILIKFLPGSPVGHTGSVHSNTTHGLHSATVFPLLPVYTPLAQGSLNWQIPEMVCNIPYLDRRYDSQFIDVCASFDHKQLIATGCVDKLFFLICDSFISNPIYSIHWQTDGNICECDIPTDIFTMYSALKCKMETFCKKHIVKQNILHIWFNMEKHNLIKYFVSRLPPRPGRLTCWGWTRASTLTYQRARDGWRSTGRGRMKPSENIQCPRQRRRERELWPRRQSFLLWDILLIHWCLHILIRLVYEYLIIW